jgi:hypothetical protein
VPLRSGHIMHSQHSTLKFYDLIIETRNKLIKQISFQFIFNKFHTVIKNVEKDNWSEEKQGYTSETNVTIGFVVWIL